jgi:glutamyl-tRNA reductase
MAKLFDGTAIEFGRFQGMLPEADIVITSSGAREYVLLKEDMQRVIAARKNKPIFVIDIGVPRNVEPSVNSVDNVFLYDIDDLQGVVNNNLEGRKKEAERAELIVAEEVDKMLSRIKVQEVAPTIVGLQEQFEEIRAAEVEKLRRKPGAMTAEQLEQVETLTRAIVNKIAHGPITELRRQAGDPEGEHIVDTIKRIFRLR